MLTKFESKSTAAKALAFHPRRPWLLVAQYSSTIQLWDYRMGTVIARFEGHDGPVRCVDFHPTQPIFVSCGDDATVRVWSLQSFKPMFQLNGHFDYVRTAFFHPEMPWIISASDDQTVRIWNWQNRQEILCLTGHSHWVTCARFHPTEDLVASSSLDLTVRVYDISALRRRLSAPSKGPGGNIEELAQAAANGSLSETGGMHDYRLKWALQGHDRGVNWVAFHPTQPLMASGGDDKAVKLWRFSDSRAWEVDTFRGHTGNVTSVVFDPFQELLLSCSDDRTIRTWDLQRRLPVQTFKREHEKFWNLVYHPTINLIGAAHDQGTLVFKLARERPAHALHQGTILYAASDKVIKEFDPRDPTERQGILSLKKFGGAFAPLRDLSYNAAEHAVLATVDDGGSGTGRIYVLAKLPAQPMGPVEPSKYSEGLGDQALFVTRNRFVVFRKQAQTLEVRDLDNSLTRTIALTVRTQFLLPAHSGHVLLAGANSVALLDVQQQKVVGSVQAANVKAAAWSPDGKYVALQAKHNITIASKDMQKVSSLHDTIRIKSVAWDDHHTVIYSTFNHLKYALLNGDSGVLKTLSQTLYVTQVRGNSVYCLSRDNRVFIIKVDPTESRFKRALVNGNFAEVARLIKSSHLVGQSIIAYLQDRGYPEIALQFVQDPQTKFDLAIECGDLATAAEQAQLLNKSVAETLLASEALVQGNHDVLEDILQKQRSLDKLAFLYLITGNKGRLQKMEQIADARGDGLARFQTSLFLGSVENRVALLREGGQYPLAYAAAKSAGLAELAAEIAAEAGIDEATIDVPVTDVSNDNAVGVSNDTYKSVWPLKERHGADELLAQAALTVDTEAAADETAEDAEDIEAADALADDLDELDVGDDWDLDVEVEDAGDDAPAAETGAGAVAAANAAGAVTEPEQWLRSSHVPADHVAAGSFETAAQLLNRQAGVVNFAPLRPRFMEVYEASKLYLTGHEGLSPLEFYVRRAASSGKKLPFVPGFDSLSAQLQEAYKLVKANRIELAIDTFREILYKVLVLAVEEKEVAECLKIVDICRNYILAFSIELKRRSLPAADVKRNLELAAYFTKPTLRPAHAALPLQVALTQAFQNKNYALASHFAGEYLKLVKTGPGAEKVRKIKARCDANPLDEVDIDFDLYADFDICPGTLTPIYKGQPVEKEPFTGAAYHASQKGKLDTITGVTVVGAPASGLRLAEP